MTCAQQQQSQHSPPTDPLLYASVRPVLVLNLGDAQEPSCTLIAPHFTWITPCPPRAFRSRTRSLLSALRLHPHHRLRHAQSHSRSAALWTSRALTSTFGQTVDSLDVCFLDESRHFCEFIYFIDFECFLSHYCSSPTINSASNRLRYNAVRILVVIV